MKNRFIIFCLFFFGSSCFASKKEADESKDEKDAKEVHIFHHYYERPTPRVGLGFGFVGPSFYDDYYPFYRRREPGVSFNFGFSGGGGHHRRHRRH